MNTPRFTPPFITHEHLFTTRVHTASGRPEKQTTNTVLRLNTYAEEFRYTASIVASRVQRLDAWQTHTQSQYSYKDNEYAGWTMDIDMRDKRRVLREDQKHNQI
jgi:hypothetical protein